VLTEINTIELTKNYARNIRKYLINVKYKWENKATKTKNVGEENKKI
jgi:hypothetical protein